MADVSVGQVSGFIAAGVFVLQIFLPLAIPAILVAFLTDTQSLVTWSVLSRFLHSSPWPTLLSTDSARMTGVKRRITAVSTFLTVGLALISVASIVTPLGLFESVEPEDETEGVHFSYIGDRSAFGYGTPPRSGAYLTRYCGSDYMCPGNTKNETCHTVGLLQNCTSVEDVRIPEEWITPFRKGAASFSPSVSSIFDIEWRTYMNQATNPQDGTFLTPEFRQLSVLILDEKIEPVEGLIVDMKTGGLGFRNHTVPSSHFPYGTKWTEDILFVHPETKCVNTNFTMDFRLPEDLDSNSGTAHERTFAQDLRLTDRGGFSGLRNRSPPSRDSIINGQEDLNLKERAADAAWFNNFLTMLFYNATDRKFDNISRLDVSEGDTFPFPAWLDNTTFRVGHDVIRTSMEFGSYLNISGSPNVTRWSENPHNVSRDEFAFISNHCAGSTHGSVANLNTSLVGCGLVYGAATPVNSTQSPLVSVPGSAWSVPVYSCASAVTASIQSVTFQFNGTDLKSLKILSVEPKTYADNESRPLWAVEDLDPITIQNGRPLWGILGSSNQSDTVTYPSNYSTVSNDKLYLPGFLDDYTTILSGIDAVPLRKENLAGTSFYNQALLNAFWIGPPGERGNRPYADYSGFTSLALFAKWQKLSKTPEGAATLLDLVWTDAAANAVVGSTGWGLESLSVSNAPPLGGKPAGDSGGDSSSDDTVRKRDTHGESGSADNPLVPVTVFKRHIRYQIPYAVPAFIVLAIAALIVGALVVLCVSRKTGLSRIRYFLDATSTGRNVGLLLHPDNEDRSSKNTKIWARSVGSVLVKANREEIRAKDSKREAAQRGEDGEELDQLISKSQQQKTRTRTQTY